MDMFSFTVRVGSADEIESDVTPEDLILIDFEIERYCAS